ncbi:MAG: MoxR family ATPase [Planctomycetes bacterium]|jgi:MoxR-like ATPase|nr:MoxR family ATPase [Planctomycetota bacterium]
MADGKKAGGPLLNLLQGRARAGTDLTVRLSERDGTSLHDKMRQAYWWIVNNAVICPYYDMEFGVRSKVKNAAGDELVLHDASSYSSFILLPLLTLFACRRALLVGGPGRGKTTSAVLMALLAGASREDVRRSILRGHPQLTVSDLLGAPLPADMLKAENASEIRVAWRKWITQRVKIVDEYNRIPTKTQSALLSLLSEGFAEMFDQYVDAGRSAWFLTANQDAGGGTFAVIEALRDRIDVVVRAVPFNSNFVRSLLERVEADASPEDLVPSAIVFSTEELDAVRKSMLAVEVPGEVLDRAAHFLGQLDFCRLASPRFEFMSKDTLKLAGRTVASVCSEQCPLDKRQHICSQTEGGVSARAFLTSLHYAKALAYFRGHAAVELEDMRQMLPWILHDKLVPNARSPFFEAKDKAVLLSDRVAWIQSMFDAAMTQYDRHKPLRDEGRLAADEIGRGLSGVDAREVQKRIAKVSTLIGKLMKQELSGPVYEDLIQLKSFYSRYRNYLQWLQEKQA